MIRGLSETSEMSLPTLKILGDYIQKSDLEGESVYYRLLKRLLYDVVRYLFIARLAGFTLRRLALNYRSTEDLVKLAYNFRFRDPIASAIWRKVEVEIRPLQIYEEILNLLLRLRALRLMNVLEIGTANGGTLFLFAQVA